MQADSAFMRVTELLPTWPSGYLWRGRSNEQMDPEAKMGLALPHYLKLVPLAQADLEKYRKDLIEGYLYMAYYYYSQNDLTNAKTYYQQVVEPGSDEQNRYGCVGGFGRTINAHFAFSLNSPTERLGYFFWFLPTL